VRSAHRAPPQQALSCAHPVEVTPTPVLARLGRGSDRMAAGHSVRTGMPCRRRVAATDVVTRQAAAQMHPAPTDFEAIAADGLEVAGQRGQRGGLEMHAASHSQLLSSRQSSLRATAAWHLNRGARRPAWDQGRAKRDRRRRRSPAEVSNATICRDDTGWAPSASAAP
jgi:hypothetical protein